MLQLRSTLDKALDRAIICAALVKENIKHELSQIGQKRASQWRLGAPAWSSKNKPENQNICIFVMYAKEKSLSTISYIEALAEAGFEIIAINNAETPQDLLEELSTRCWRVYNRLNIGRDFGAYKDGVLMLIEEGFLNNCASLCLANDSMHFIPGLYGKAFTSEIKAFLASTDIALFSHISHQVSRHYQSYFQILKSEVLNSEQFISFWEAYRPLSHREHCIHKGEIALSSRVYNRIARARVLYTTEKCLNGLCVSGVEPPSVDYILGMMPSTTKTKQKRRKNYALDQLLLAASNNDVLSEINQHYLMDLLESSNPSHAGAFLFPMLIKCPLVKHDLCFAGSFSKAKALHLFRIALTSSGLQEPEVNARLDEFRRTITAKGIPADYMKRPKERALKGVNKEYIYTTL